MIKDLVTSAAVLLGAGASSLVRIARQPLPRLRRGAAR